jgi:DNA-binding CsgD family transcriptional regulator
MSNLEEIWDKLSPRQKQIIQLRADGYSYKEIYRTFQQV